ncbi:MAG: serine/threonine-protein kinase [Myxococcota bacterium]
MVDSVAPKQDPHDSVDDSITGSAEAAKQIAATLKKGWIPIQRARLDEDYTLVARLGQGGMAEIYLAVHHGLSGFRKLVVIKRLLPHMAHDPEVVQMFLDEARLAARLNHPHVVQTTKVGAAEGHYFLAMEFLDGQPLNRILRRQAELGRRMPPALAARIIADALEGLHYAHCAKDFDGSPLRIVHRDVSPHNLMVTYDGVVKILDFGIAKATLQEAATRTGLIKGKFAYISPEQATGETVDQRADVWSMGVCLWECLAGRRLFKGKSEVATLHESLTKEIPEIVDYAGEVPRELEEIAFKALQRDMGERYPSAEAMRADLEDWLAEQSHEGSRARLGAWVNDLFSDAHAKQRTLIKRLTEFPDESRHTLASLATGTHPAFELPLTGSHTGLTGRSLAPEAEKEDDRLKLALLALVLLLAGVLIFVLTRTRAAPDGPAAGAVASEGAGATEQVAGAGDAPTTPIAAAPAAESEAPGVGPAEAAADEPVGVEIGTDVAPTAMGEAEAPVDEESARRARLAARRRARANASATDAPAEEAPAPATTGFLTLDTAPWSHVDLNGRRLGTTPLLRVELPTGRHTLTLTNPEQNIATRYTVTIEEGRVYARRLGLE